MDVKKINIITSSLVSGGSEKNAVFLSNEFSKKNYLTTLISLKDDGILKKKVSKNVKLILLGKKRNRYKLLSLFLILRTKRQILSIMRDSNILCLICGLFLKNIKIIVREGNRLNNLNFFYSFLIKILYLRANQIIVNSKDIEKDLNKPFGILKKKIVKIHNPILTNKNSKNKNNRKKSKIKNILNISKFYDQKNHDLLIDIFYEMLKKNKNLNLLLVGEGPEKKKIINKIKKLNIKQKVKIFKPNINVEYFYKISDLFLLTSKYEGFPNVLAEAISNKLYTISTPSSSSVNDIIFDKKLGIVSKSFSAKEISKIALNNIDKKITDNEKFIKKFSPKKILLEYKNILDMNL